MASTARVRITTTLDDASGSWGVNRIRVTLVLPHPSPPAPPTAPGQWDMIASNVWNIGSQGLEGWHGVPGPNLTSNCGEGSTIVGGYGHFGKGAFLERTFSSLPAHWGLRLRLDFLLIDYWGRENAQIFIDGSLAWSSSRRNWNDWTTLGDGYGWDHPCGRRKWRQSDVVAHVDTTTYHFKESATIRITTEASQNYQWWGVQDFKLETMTPHPSPPAPPFAPGVWEAPFGLISREIFPGRNEGWSGVPSAEVTTVCGELGTFLGGDQVFGVGAYVEKTFVNLPAHHGIRVQFTFLKVDHWNGRQGVALLDGGEIWRSDVYHQQGGYTDGRHGSAQNARGRGDNGCGVKGYNQGDLAIEVEVSSDHYSPNATLRFTSTLDQPNDYWGIQDVRFSLVQDHPSPPAPPHPPGVWDYLVMHDRWPGATGWSGNVSLDASSVTTCGWLGTMIGGFERFGRGAYIEKTIDELSPHSGMRVQAQFYKIDQWNGKRGQLFVDDMLVWESDSYHQQSSGPQVQGTCCCGVKGYNQGWVHGRQTL